MKLSLGLFRSWKFHRASSLEADNSEERRHFSFKFNSASRSYHVTTIMMRFLYALQGSFILWKQIKKKPKRVRLYYVAVLVFLRNSVHARQNVHVVFFRGTERNPPDNLARSKTKTLSLYFVCCISSEYFSNIFVLFCALFRSPRGVTHLTLGCLENFRVGITSLEKWNYKEKVFKKKHHSRIYW